MNEVEFKARTVRYALDVIRLVEGLPKTRTADIVGRQLLRSATSVGANYRASCRAKSPADFVAKLAIVEEEADECLYWIELLVKSGLTTLEHVQATRAEGEELLAMTVASIKTARSR